MSIFIKDGYLCIINKDKEEETEHFYTKGWFIVSQKSNEEEYTSLYKYYNLWRNNKYYKCSYSQDIMNILEDIEKKIWTK